MASTQNASIFSVKINNIHVDEVLSFIQSTIDNNAQAVIAYVNIHALNLCYEIKWFRDFFNTCQLVFCDGVGVQLGAALLGQKIDHRFTPPDWIDRLCQFAAENNWPIYFLGAKPGVAELAAEKLVKSNPGLIITCHHGYFNHAGSENEAVIKKINDSGAKIVLVGMGMPRQERWIIENFHHTLSANVILPVGAMFDYVAGVVPRGPRWMTDHGFEWLSRLIIEPKRLWKRYLIGNPRFLWRVLKQRLGVLNLEE
jgi:N-acetylglucosaminyldiphosphoundecaprenol N-acetyl-beta-D-mannosaminyltransferase